MNPPHPPRKSLSPSYLRSLAELAQEVAHRIDAWRRLHCLPSGKTISELADLMTELDNRLALSSRDLKRRSQGPAADPELAKALHELRTALQDILPASSEQLLRTYISRLTKPQVDAYGQAAKHFCALVDSRFPIPVSHPWRGESEPAPGAAEAGKPGGPVLPQEQLPANVIRRQKALALIMAKPDWTDRKYAKALGCHRATLYRDEIIKKALKGRRGSKQQLPRGYKSGKTGAFDAWKEDD